MTSRIKSYLALALLGTVLSACSSHCTCPPQPAATTIVTPSN